MDSALIFFQRSYPSANMVLIRGKQPLLVDSGFGGDLPRTESLIGRTGIRPQEIQYIINTHYHSDHVGGNSALQQRYGLQVAAHRWEGQLVNHKHREACAAQWLDQPVESYRVSLLLVDGDEIDTGSTEINVCHTPGHTLGHISLYLPGTRELICGDLLQTRDVGWINIFREGTSALSITLDSLEKLDRLPLSVVYPGHGPLINEPRPVIARARKRLERWLTRPEEAAWHACKRIFAYALMINRGLPGSEINDYLLACNWFIDFSRHIFRIDPPDFVQPLVDEMTRSGAGFWRDGHLHAATPHNPPGDDWPPPAAKPSDWPFRRVWAPAPGAGKNDWKGEPIGIKKDNETRRWVF